mmetsp:Transcript_36421/g.100304  ORF Transcript_36421/g.100304 Transcript_36421/m.100304 type:complete len:524 (-) Transcript_36421:138-1709(-)
MLGFHQAMSTWRAILRFRPVASQRNRYRHSSDAGLCLAATASIAAGGVVVLSCDSTSADAGKLLSIKKQGGNTCRDAQYKRGCELVDLSSYDKVTIDLRRMIATAGASVTMEQLSQECLSKGVIPLVVPEFKAITVGGAVMGGGVESSSGKHGEFSETCESCTLRLGNGEVVTCSETERRDLFDALSGSYGSLALLLSADIRVMRAEPQVRLTYTSFEEIRLAIDFLLQAARSHDFAEGLSFPDHCQGPKHVVVTADFDNTLASPPANIMRPSDPWFYERVLAAVAVGASEELVTTEEYLHRHERGAFWMARPQGDLVGNTFGGYLFGALSTPPLRSWFDHCWKTTFLFRMLKAAPQATIADNFLITDIYADPGDVEDLLREVRSGNFTLSTPIWLCPVKAPKRRQLLSANGNRGGEDIVLIDVGLYGRITDHAGIAAARHFERWGEKHNARKMLYSQSYYSEAEFWSPPMYDQREYQALRRKYGAEGTLVDLYRKVGNSGPCVASSRQESRYWWWSMLTHHT